MIAPVIAWAVKRGTPAWAVRGGLVVLAAAVLIGGFLLWDRLDDKAAVRSANLESDRNTAVTTLESERRASAGDQVRAEARANAFEQTRDELETIHAEDPQAAAAPASRGARAVARRLPQS